MADEDVTEADLPRIKREIEHNKRKFDRQRRENERRRAADLEAGLRAPDQQRFEALVGGAAIRGNRRGPPRNADGFIIPVAMRNYNERDILCGLITLRSFNRVDLFWGRIKDVERDFLYAHIYTFGMMIIILIYTLTQVNWEGQKYTGNI